MSTASIFSNGTLSSSLLSQDTVETVEEVKVEEVEEIPLWEVCTHVYTHPLYSPMSRDEEKKKKKMMKCRLCGENVPDDVELQQLHEKWYHYQEVIEIEEEPHESVHLPKSGRKIRKISCACCE